MRLVLSWLKEFVDIDASADEIAGTLGLRGFEVASIEALADGDAVIDFEITANRPDCLSVLGLAREVSTAFDLPLTLPSTARGAAVPLEPLTPGRSERQAVAGVMGGADSEVSDATRVVVFESAYFQPASVRRTSKRLGLKTEASSRFERGADISVQVVAIKRAAALMKRLNAGTVVGPVV